MGLDYYLSLFAFLAVLVGFGIWWLRMRLGIDKRWFVVSAWPLISSSFYFFLPTFLVGFVIGLVGMLLIAPDPHKENPLALGLMYSTFGLWALGFVFVFLEPDWLCPAWYRWLKNEHGDIMPYLVHDADLLGREAWLERVERPGGLEEWVADVRSRYGRRSRSG